MMIKQAFSMMLAMGMTASALGQTGSGAVVPLETEETILDSKSYVDTYNPAAGAYDAVDNVGAAPTFTYENHMPDFTAPTGQGVFEADRLYKGTKKNPDFTLTGKLTCDTFTVSTHTKLTIEGDVLLVVRERFLIENQSQILLAPDATLKIYCLGEATIQDQTHVNPDTSRPNAVTFTKLGEQPLIIADQSSMTATVFAPKTHLQVENASHFYGMLTAKSLLVQNTAAAHFAHFKAKAPTTVAPLYD